MGKIAFAVRLFYCIACMSGAPLKPQLWGQNDDDAWAPQRAHLTAQVGLCALGLAAALRANAPSFGDVRQNQPNT